MGCRACGSSGGGCQVSRDGSHITGRREALGFALPHSALAPSGEPVWLELATRRIKQAPDKLVAERFLLPDDVAGVISRAGRHWSYATGTSATAAAP